MSDSRYGTAQVCLKGHVITPDLETSPKSAQEFCSECGAETVTQCPSCGERIRGYHHVPGVISLHPYELPRHCNACGKPYPWAAIQADPQLDAVEDGSQEPTSARVFVVHGRDQAARESVARVLERLGLDPLILREQPGQGRTLIEKFETYADVRFAVVLLTPDDVGGLNEDEPDLRPRARQNVLLELGYFLGRLGRQNVCALYREGVEIPSDYQGVQYVPLDEHDAWHLKVAKELRVAGFDVDLNVL